MRLKYCTRNAGLCPIKATGVSAWGPFHILVTENQIPACFSPLLNIHNHIVLACAQIPITGHTIPHASGYGAEYLSTAALLLMEKTRVSHCLIADSRRKRKVGVRRASSKIPDAQQSQQLLFTGAYGVSR